MAAGCADTGGGVTLPLHAGRQSCQVTISCEAFVFNFILECSLSISSVLCISEIGLPFCFDSYFMVSRDWPNWCCE